MLSPIALGPFQLDAHLGRGGMGEVWSGRHVGRGVPVAVKVLTGPLAQVPAYRAAFRDEVRAVAALGHPGIVMVFDHGEVDPAAAEASHGALPAGSPYLAMELASRGSLDRLREHLSWPELRAALLALLDALAHAHARGVLHRDIKPGNILLGAPDDLRPGLRLTDFGLGWAMEAAGDPGAVVGTPRYMAPEQFVGAWRDFGPWTDLYALGCVAWELVSGAPPFAGEDPVELGRAHHQEPLPPLAPRVPVPDDLGAWLGGLLAKDPAHRYQRAADAAWALVHLAEPGGHAGATSQLRPYVSNPTLTLDDTLLLAAPIGPGAPPRPSPAARPPAPEGADGVLPPLAGGVTLPPPQPASWRRPEPTAPPLHLSGAGLGLYALRAVPLVGREAERDLLWNELAAVRADDAPRAVVVGGPSGIGKSRLGRWLGQRAEEVGAATLLTAVHGPFAGPGDGLAGLLARRLRCAGATRPDVEARAREVLVRLGVPDPGEALALAELVSPSPSLADPPTGARLPRGTEAPPPPPALPVVRPAARPTGPDGPAIRFASPRERFAALHRHLRLLARERPLVVWIDDVQWGLDALAFVEWALTDAPPIAALFVLTAQAEALAELPAARERVDALVARRGVRSVTLGPLPDRDVAGLLDGLLGLEPGLAGRVVARVRGNPLFAVQLVGDWVHRGLLVPSDAGFTLRPGARVDLPDDLHAVWTERVHRLLAGPLAKGRPALEVAAALGALVDDAEWAAACATAAAPLPPGLRDTLLARQLAVPAEGGWRFTHGMLRESLERRARDEGRWETLHAACAEALAGLGSPSARVGRHLHAARRWTSAVRELSAAVAEALPLDDTDLIAELLAPWEEALTRLATPIDDPAWGELWIARAHRYERTDAFDDADREAQRVLVEGGRFGWPTRAAGFLVRGRIARKRGDVPAALRFIEQALDQARADGLPREEARALRGIGHVKLLGGELDAAEGWLRHAREAFAALGDRKGYALCLNSEGDIARLRGDFPTAVRCFSEALEIYRERGESGSVALCLHGIAEMERLSGQFDDAEAGYRAVIALDERAGRETLIPRLNLALCNVDRGDHAAARPALDAVRAEFQARRRRGYVPFALVALLPCHAAARDAARFAEDLTDAEVLIQAAAIVDTDLATYAERGGDLAIAAGWAALARRAWRLAHAQWSAVGRTDRAETLAERLGALPAD